MNEGRQASIFLNLQGMIDDGPRIVIQGEQELMLSCRGQLMEKRELRG